MKIIKYKILQPVNPLFEVEDDVKLCEKMMQWSEATEEIAKAEAYNGEYTIEDDEQIELVV